MKRVYIIHGWGGNPDEPMLQWLKMSLSGKGYMVSVPEMPDTDYPAIDKWVSKILGEVGQFNDEVILVGHSIGCQAVMRALERVAPDRVVAGMVLIAPWMELDEETMKEEEEEDIETIMPWVETP